MQDSSQRRRKYLVDHQIQGAILQQAGFYWVYGFITYTLIVSIYRIMPSLLSGENVTLGMVWYHLAPLVVSSVILLPMVIVRAVRFSHRFVGPMVRFRKVLGQLSRGEPAPKVALRPNDFWKDIAEEINRVSARFDEVSAKAP